MQNNNFCVPDHFSQDSRWTLTNKCTSYFILPEFNLYDCCHDHRGCTWVISGITQVHSPVNLRLSLHLKWRELIWMLFLSERHNPLSARVGSWLEYSLMHWSITGAPWSDIFSCNHLLQWTTCRPHTCWNGTPHLRQTLIKKSKQRKHSWGWVNYFVILRWQTTHSFNRKVTQDILCFCHPKALFSFFWYLISLFDMFLFFYCSFSRQRTVWMDRSEYITASYWACVCKASVKRVSSCSWFFAWRTCRSKWTKFLVRSV